jgi:DHA3 family tetracycline resistance protein-like MFS transporter
LFPAFLPILVAQVVWGLGYTFTSGASQAWITDEVGEESANKLFMRATQVGLVAGLLGMGLAMLIGSTNVAVPIQLGAVGVMLIGITLIFIMPETGFHPTPREDRNNWQHMWHIFNEGLKAVKARPRLLTVLGVGLFYGLYSEGFDRLWVKHLIETFDIPIFFGTNQVAFFSVLRITSSLLAVFAVRFVEKRVDSGSSLAIGRAVMIVTGLLGLSIIGFAISPLFALTLGLYLAISIFRNVSGPLHSAWVNQKLDPKVRATVHSMAGQVDAIGQVGGGPGVALIAKYLSVVAAITTSGFLLFPAMWLTGRANTISAEDEATPVAVAE